MDRYINGVDRLAQLQRQFLVHSFLYYQLDESIWEDSKYDECCNELLEYLRFFPSQGPYYNLCKGLDESGSGFYLSRNEYPPEIVTSALRTLWASKTKQVPFDKFIAQWGYSIIETPNNRHSGDETGASLFLPA